MNISSSGLAAEVSENSKISGKRKSCKRLLTIEQALRWAYVDELPKMRQMMSAGPSIATSSSTASYLELLTSIDRNRYGCVPDLSASIAPHVDALLIGEAVLGLAGVEIGEQGEDVLGDVEGLTDIERAECNARGFLIAGQRLGDCSILVMRRAILGGAPTWHGHGEVTRAFEQGPNGRAVWRRLVTRPGGFGLPDVEIEVDGYDARTHRAHRDAWRRTILTPDPAILAAERIEYQAFVLLLGILASELAGQLATIDVTESRLPSWPWDDGEARQPARRVLLAKQST